MNVLFQRWAATSPNGMSSIFVGPVHVPNSVAVFVLRSIVRRAKVGEHNLEVAGNVDVSREVVGGELGTFACRFGDVDGLYGRAVLHDFHLERDAVAFGVGKTVFESEFANASRNGWRSDFANR